jgi:hypothetical protein
MTNDEVRMTNEAKGSMTASTLGLCASFVPRDSPALKGQQPVALNFSFKIIKKPPASAVFLCIMSKSFERLLKNEVG